MNISTAWWCGDPPKYSRDYVRALRAQLAPHRLIVLGEDVVFRYPRLTGWWSKLEILAPENRALRPCLHIDLDTFITGDISPILNLDGSRLWMIRQFLSRTELAESGLFIAPDTDLADTIWNRLKNHPLEGGDGPFLRTFPHSFIPDEVDGIYSFKKHCADVLRTDARVVCFHGLPKPADLIDGWGYEWWNRWTQADSAT